MRRSRFCACVLSCICLIGAAASGAPLYHVTDLGAASSSAASNATAIGNAGGVTGQSPTGGVYQHAFYWSNGTGMIDIGDFAGGADVSLGADVNGQGHVAGFGAVQAADASDSGLRVLFWSGAGGLQNLGKPAGSDGAMANAINSSDQIVGQYNIGNSLRAFLWTGAGGFSDMGDLPNGGSGVFAMDINDLGVAVGTSNGPNFRSRGFRWTAAGGMQQLADLSSTAQKSFPNSINNSGAIVGTSTNDAGADRAALWKPTGEVIDLAAPISADRESEASAINNFNQVVGTLTVTDGVFKAFVWTEQSGIQQLDNLLDSSGQGWDLNTGNGINDAGQIVGQGIYCATASSCVEHGYLLTPVPEPGVLVMMAAVAIGLAGRRRGVC